LTSKKAESLKRLPAFRIFAREGHAQN